MIVGVISDSHGFLDPEIPNIFSRVDHIVHAGDIGNPGILLELENIAPVTAVLGNTDYMVNCELTEVVELSKRKFLVHHILDPNYPEESVRLRIAREKPDVVIFGHTHRAFAATIKGTLYLNPGYAGRPRHNQTRSVALVDLRKAGILPRFVSL